MVKIYILTLLFSLAIFVNGQTVDTTDAEMVTFIKETPVFNGDLKEFIQEELIYPSGVYSGDIDPLFRDIDPLQ